ncbi:DUF3549 family protein [Paraglaciecola hydrolytica]|uniref:DUF3549 domain-containing protein n=1 Tax=Paraglaciecola hydrolytica TaxID=1799789 RepID=A0A135ZYW9_9ALTE|nr:DUF3549 family protein [Paraglaciecola hydrolytica]KXI28175.1 hypothetical protein AX660_17505 [Paraglaciecola hydrolytica]
MSQINSISEFLLHAGTNYRIFDMGRAIRPITSQLFLDIELGNIPAHFPRAQHAWFGIIFFNPTEAKEHYIWFIKLPLDEQGLVLNAARQQFLQIVVDALGQQLDKNANNQLPENPYTFVPAQQQRADFNSLSRLSLVLPPSQYYALAAQYVKNPQVVEWQNLSIQGIADLVAYIQQEQLEDTLIAQFQYFSPEVQLAFCQSFENHCITTKCSNMLLDWWHNGATTQERLLALLRALSQSNEQSLLNSFIQQLLEQEDWLSQDVLILLAARHWQRLDKLNLMRDFMHKLAESGSGLFVALFRDLVLIPDTRDQMLKLLRCPDKPLSLTIAIEHLFASQNL